MYHNSLFMYSVNIMAFDITVVTCLLKTSILNYLVFVVLFIGCLVGKVKDQASRFMKFLHSKLNSKKSIIIFLTINWSPKNQFAHMLYQVHLHPSIHPKGFNSTDSNPTCPIELLQGRRGPFFRTVDSAPDSDFILQYIESSILNGSCTI